MRSCLLHGVEMRDRQMRRVSVDLEYALRSGSLTHTFICRSESENAPQATHTYRHDLLLALLLPAYVLKFV
jgi:hypothetical protein